VSGLPDSTEQSEQKDNLAGIFDQVVSLPQQGVSSKTFYLLLTLLYSTIQ
jgi:hypothetical protein